MQSRSHLRDARQKSVQVTHPDRGHPRLERPPGVELVESPECAEWVMGAFGEQGKSLNRAALSGKLLLNFGNG